ncbi:reverse transcriptase domain-containing protein [Tanacetum coccineum]
MNQAPNQSSTGALPSNTIPNPREDIKVIITWSGITLARPLVSSPNSSSSSKEVERDPEPTMDQLPEKLRDPGKFLIPYDFSELEECMALADLGANINLMPLFVWKKLMLPELIPTRMTLELANRSVTYPAGIAEDVFMQVGKFMFPADFVVVDYDVDPCVPIILGRPFLRTAHALVDVHREELTLRVGDEKLIFNVESILKYPRKHGDESINKIDIIDTTEDALPFDNFKGCACSDYPDARVVGGKYNGSNQTQSKVGERRLHLQRTHTKHCLLRGRIFKHSLSHGKDDLSLVQLGSHLRIEESLREQKSDNCKGKEVARPSVNMMKEGGKNKKPNKTKERNVVSRITTVVLVPTRNLNWNVGSVAKLVTLIQLRSGLILVPQPMFVKIVAGLRHMNPWEERYVPLLVNDHFAHVSWKKESRAVAMIPNPKRKTLGEKGIDCIFVGYAEHSKAYRFYVIEPNDSISINTIIETRDAIFNENRFSSIHRTKDIIPNSDESQGDEHSNNVPSETLEPHSSSTSGWVFLLGGGAISWASKKQTCINGSTMESEFVSLADASKEAQWLRNLIHEIPIWPKPIALISIYCDSATTLAKAYIQIHNGKSRHLGVRHSMIRELIVNGVISIEFVRSEHNLAYHLTKALARDLVIRDEIKVHLDLLPMRYPIPF